MSIIQEAKEIIKLFKSGKLTAAYSDLIRVQRHPTEPLVLLNYTQKTQYLKQWDRTTMLCRGLIINPDTEEIVSLPWKKFFNLNETPETQVETLSSKPFVAFEKLDGSIGISYWIKDEIFLASRGAFNSEEATCGTMYLKQLNWSVLPKELTFLFEIISQQTRP